MSYAPTVPRVCAAASDSTCWAIKWPAVIERKVETNENAAMITLACNGMLVCTPRHTATPKLSILVLTLSHASAHIENKKIKKLFSPVFPCFRFAPMSLDNSQIQFFNAKGYLLLKNVLQPDEVRARPLILVGVTVCLIVGIVAH